jgi:hypothetical protein
MSPSGATTIPVGVLHFEPWHYVAVPEPTSVTVLWCRTSGLRLRSVIREMPRQSTKVLLLKRC